MLTFKDELIDRVYFKNLDRVPERELFDKAKNILDNNPAISFGKLSEIAYVDVWNGSYNGIAFELWLDIDYGPFILCTDEVVLKEIEKILNAA